MTTSPLDQNDGENTLLFQRSHLLIEWPDGAQQTYVFKQDVVRIGRGAEDNDVAAPIEYKSISRNHLEIRREGAGYRVADLGSANGILLNGEMVDGSIHLDDGDKIQIGADTMGEEVRMIFRLGVEVMLARLQATQKPAVVSGSTLSKYPPEKTSYLEVRWTDGRVEYFPIQQDTALLGRHKKAALRFPSTLKFISNRHAIIQRDDSGFTITDLDSTNGTRVNNRLIAPETPTPLPDGAIIRIGDEDFGISVGLTFHAPPESRFRVAGFSPSAVTPTVVMDRPKILIGRDPECDIVLNSPEISRIHAHVRQIGEAYWIEDLDSANGVFVNKEPGVRIELHDGDLIQIGAHILLFKDGQLAHYQSQGMRVDVIGLSQDVKTRSGPLRILHDINMTVLPREFIAIVGGSGAGKSTLMNALIGSSPGKGQMQLNGHNFYKEYEHFRAQLGYVPQSDILHTSLTVGKALDYAARLRMSADFSAEERTERIAAVLDVVNMNTDTIRNTRISNLSGGQRKRVSIAAELLADPKLIYLDEATSGLDPGLEKKMMHTLRRMADEGRTVLLITHATDNIVQTDHVAFLSQGRLIYFGPSSETLDFFEVGDFADIYQRIERHGEKWQQVFREEKNEQYKKYVLKRQDDKLSASKRELPRIRFGIRDFIRQLTVLTQRAMVVLSGDWFTLVLMLLLFPLTATLQLVIASSDILIGNLAIIADPVAAAADMVESYMPFADLNTFIFVMGLEAALVGMYVPSNELIKERTVYLRERMVNLKVLPYLLSKVIVFTLFAIIQTILYLLVLSIGVDLPEQGLYFSAPVELFITLFLAMMAGMGIGFVISAISRSSDMAIYMLVILLFFQFFFAGTVFDLRENTAEPLSYLTITRWTLTALGVTIDMEEQVEATILCNPLPDNPMTPQNDAETVCFNHTEATENLMLPYDDDKLAQSWGALLLMTFVALTITGIQIKRLDKT